MKKSVVLFYTVAILFALSTPGLKAENPEFERKFEILFFVRCQGTQIEFDDTSFVEFNEDSLGQYYSEALDMVNHYRKRNFDQFNEMLSNTLDRFSRGFEFDTLGYLHYLQYRKFYHAGQHRQAMEQLIYAKETFKRKGNYLMYIECLSRYYGNYTSSIFTTAPVEGIDETEQKIEFINQFDKDPKGLDFWAKMVAYEKMGVLFGLDGQLKKSNYYLNQVIEKLRDSSYQRAYYNALGDLSINQYREGDYNQSIKNAVPDLKSSLEINALFSTTALGVVLAKNHIALGQLKEAGKYLQLADSFSIKMNGVFQMDILETKADYFWQLGQIEKANDIFRQYLKQKDSVNLNAIREMEFRTKTQQDYYLKLTEYERKNIENLSTIKAQKIQNTTIMIILGFLLSTLIIFGWLVYYIRKKNKVLLKQKAEIDQSNQKLVSQKEELESQNEFIKELNQNLEMKVRERTQDLEEKAHIISTFFYHMSHRFRSPVASLKGLINLVMIDHKSEDIPNYLRLANESIDKLDALLNHVRQLLEFDQLAVFEEKVSLFSIVNEIIGELSFKYGSNEVLVYNQLSESNSPIIQAVRGYKKVLFKEVLDNAFKFSITHNRNKNEKAKISISLETIENFYKLIIEDNGPGISPDLFEQIFQPFYVGNESSGGDGLGFYIASVAARKTGCTIAIDHLHKKGTRMIIMIPMNKVS